MKILTPLIFLALSVGMYLWVISPQFEQVKTLKNDNIQYQTVLDRSDQTTAKWNQLQAVYRNFPQDNLTKLAKIIPDKVDPIRLIIDINAVAAKDGLILSNMGVSDPSSGGAANPAYGTVNLSFNTIASYDKFLQFVNDVQHSLQLMELSSVTFNAPADGKPYSYTFTFTTYWLK